MTDEKKTSSPGEVLGIQHGVPVLKRTGLRRIGVIQARVGSLDDVVAEAYARTVDEYREHDCDDDDDDDYDYGKGKHHGEGSHSGRSSARKAAKHINKHGLADEIDEATDRLNRTGMSETARLLLSSEEVYGYLILEALKEEKIDGDDVTGIVESIKRNVEDEPRSFFEGTLVQRVFLRNHIDLPDKPGTTAAGQYERLLRCLRETGISLDSGTAEQRVLQLQRETAIDGDLPSLVEAWAEGQGITNGQGLPLHIRTAMVASLKRLNIPFDDGDVEDAPHNHYFAIAYDQATRAGTGAVSDPISLTRVQGSFSAWDFRVDTFDAAEEQGVVPENIRAAGALDYVYFLGDVLGVYKIADALVLRWAAGLLDIQDVRTSSDLYRYWQLRDGRLSEDERGTLYTRALAKGDNAQLLSGMVANEAFPGLWHSLMGAVADYIRDMTDAAKEGAVSRIPIYRATQALQYNLSEYMTGMAPMQVTDMYMQLAGALDILGSPEIVAQLSSGPRRGVWSVIDRIGKEELNQSIDVGTVRTLAVQGNKVFQWIADFDRGTVTDGQFDDLRDAAEAWIIAASGAEGVGAPPESSGDEEGDEGDFDFEGDLESEDPELAW